MVHNVHDMMDPYVEQLVRAIRTSYGPVRTEIRERLAALVRQMEAEAAAGGTVSPQLVYEQGRLLNQLTIIERPVSDYAAIARNQLAVAQQYAVQMGRDAADASLRSTVPAGVTYTFGVPSPQALAQMTASLTPHSPTWQLFEQMPGDIAQQMRQALFTGLTLGDNPRTIGARMASYSDMPVQRAEVIARTETLRAYRHAQMATYRANADVVGQWRWSADKSGRTCGACLAMDGSLHDLDESLDDHVCGRCAAVPVTKSWADILGPLGIDTSDIPDTPDRYESGSDWFARQSASLQTDVLGPAKQAAYAQGDITLQDLVGYQHHPVWGSSIEEQSLRHLGLNARQYLKGA